MIKVNVEKAKQISHEVRRTKRTEEFKPLDVQATIPSLALEAEAQRQVIRDKHAAIQAEIDAAADADTLKQILTTNNLL